MMEKLYEFQACITSIDSEDLAMQLETIADDIRDGVEVKKTNVQGISNGSWHIQYTERCEYCHGDGEVATDEDDGEGHTMRGVGTQKCVCKSE